MIDKESYLLEIENRSKRCLCKYCGGKLEIHKIFFGTVETARTEIFCDNCDRIEYVVEPEIYNVAKSYVREFAFNCYPDLEESQQTTDLNIARVCEILTWYSQSLGVLTPDGFIPEVQKFFKQPNFLLQPNERIEEC